MPSVGYAHYMHLDWSTDVILAGLFENCHHAIFVLNDHGELVFRNQAYRALEERQPELEKCLAMPDELAAGRPVQASIYLRYLEEPLREGKVLYLPLCDGMGKVSAVLGQILPGDVSPSAMPWSDGMAEKLRTHQRELRQRYQWDQFIAAAPATRRALAQAKLAAVHTAPVLLIGEAGTGKRTLARAIHATSAMASQAFAALACDLLNPQELRETLANWGLLSDGVERSLKSLPSAVYLGDLLAMPRDLQAELAGIMKEQRDLPRILAGCIGNSLEACRDGSVHEGLYWQLANVTIELPPLRERKDEIPLLVQHRLGQFSRNNGERVPSCDNVVMEAFLAYGWPGNVKQLFEVIDHAAARCTDGMIRVDDLPFDFRSRSELARIGSPVKPKPLPLDELLTQTERQLIETALRESRGNISKAADRLQISRARLYRRMETLGLVQQEGAEGFVAEESQ